MRNTKKVQEKKYPSIFSIIPEGSTLSDIEPFDTLGNAREYVDDYLNDDNAVIVEYTPVAVYSLPKNIEWVKESLIE